MNKDFYIKTATYRFLKSKIYSYAKNLIPFKNYFKNFVINNLIYSNFKYSAEEEKFFQSKIKNYYENSNSKFFNQVKINNKYNY